MENIVAAIAFALVLSCAVGSKALSGAGIDLPEWTGVGKVHSFLEGRDYTQMPSPSVKGYLRKEYQKQFDEFVADSIPMRDEVLLANASLQRSCIEVANACFGYACYPTFFGSNYLYIPESHALMRSPLSASDSKTAGLKSFGDGIADLAKRYPDKRFLLYVVDRSDTSSMNPAVRLQASALTTGTAVDILGDRCAGTDNITVESVCYSTADERYGDFFSTDHHWNILGASRAYNLIADRLGLEPFDPLPTIAIQGPRFMGSYARNGLYPMDEEPFDTEFDFGELAILDYEGNETDEENVHRKYYENLEENQRHAFYSSWYGTRSDSPKILGPGHGEAILICDSYGQAIKRPLAMNYEILYTESDLHDDNKNDSLTLASRIDRPEIHDVIFVGSVNDYIGMEERMPSYFEYERVNP